MLSFTKRFWSAIANGSAIARVRGLVRSARADDEGLSGIEFAIIAPVLILSFIATADFGLAIYAKMEVENAAQAGTQYAAANGYTSSSVSSAVTAATNLSGLTASPAPNEFCGCPSTSGVTTATCNTNCASGATAGTYVSASAQATYSTIISYPGIPGSYTFSSTSTVRIK
jgi:Flp pilus assembly protein TadG